MTLDLRKYNNTELKSNEYKLYHRAEKYRKSNKKRYLGMIRKASDIHFYLQWLKRA